MQMKNKTSSPLSSSSSSNQLWSFLPEDVFIYDILFKLPIDSLLRLRCVSRYFHSLITNPSFIRMHLDYSTAQLNLNLLLVTSKYYDLDQVEQMGVLRPVYKHHVCNFSSSSGTSGNDIDPSSHPNVEQMCSPFEWAGIFGSCNGLLLLHQRKNDNRGYIWNPCTKEYKELPPPPSITEEEEEHLFQGIDTSSEYSEAMSSFGFCGFGYDRTNDDYKILYQENRVGYRQLPDDVIPSDNDLVSVTEFKLYTLGTNTWTRISDNPYRLLFFDHDEWKTIGVFAHGALYWLMLSRPYQCTQAKIISFNMEKEEFQEIRKPRLEEDCKYGRLQVLQGCLCLYEFPKYDDMKKADIWMLKKNDSWTRLFTILLPDDSLAIRYLQLLRFCENGEIIMRRDRRNHLIVYDPVNQKARDVENLVRKIRYTWENVVIYIESLVSLKSGTYIV